MSANFYKVTAMMWGVDLHHYQALSPDPADALKGWRLDNAPYLVSENHAGKHDPGNVTDTVTADRKCMIRHGFTIHDISHHALVPLPPHPYQFIEVRTIDKASASTPFLKMDSVTSSGGPLAVCSVKAVGANLNCHDSGMVLSGVVLCPCTVVTKVQLAAVIERLFDDIKKIVIQGIPALIDLLLRKYKVGRVASAIIKWLVDKALPPLFDAAKAVAVRIAKHIEKHL